MKIQNHTKVPVELIREMIREVTPAGVTSYDITFKNSARGFRGRAYITGCGYHIRAGKMPPLIIVGVPRQCGAIDKPWPKVKADRGRSARRHEMGYMTHDSFTYHEQLVHLIAHELRHLWQHRVKSGRRVWGARGTYSERDADAYGIRMVRQWRRRGIQPAA